MDLRIIHDRLSSVMEMLDQEVRKENKDGRKYGERNQELAEIQDTLSKAVVQILEREKKDS